MNTLKTIKNFVIKYYKKVLFVVIIVVLGFILLAASLYNVKLDDGSFKKDDWSSVPYAASKYTEQASISDNGITIGQDAKEIWDKMVEERSNIEYYLDSPEELEKLMNAEIITQYPKTGKGNLDGIIEFERHKTDGKSSKLAYLDSETFNSYINSGNKDALNYFTLDEQGNVLIAIENITTEEITTNDSEMNISEYTSVLNETDKQTDGSYRKTQAMLTAINPPINYKNIVQKYTMPFQYLWSLLVITDDKDFVLELADLIENSEITISIYDNIKTREVTDEYTYYKESKTDTYVKVIAKDDFGVKDYPKERYWISKDSPEASQHYNEKYEADYNKDAQEYSVKKSIRYESNTPIVDVTKANTWIVDYSKEYIYQTAENTSNNVNEKTIENTEYVEMSNSPDTLENNKLLLNNLKAKLLQNEAKTYIEKNRKDSDQSNNTLFNNIKTNSDNNVKKDLFNNVTVSNNSQEVEVNIADVKCRYYTHKVDGKQKTTENDAEQKYIPGPTKNDAKVEKNSREPNFVTILCSKKHRNAKKNIQEISSWLFELLEKNDATRDMVDLTKYLLYKATGQDYGFTEYDFSVYGDSIFSGVTGGIYGNSVQEKVWYALKNLGYSDVAVAGVMGNIQHESGFKTNNIQNSYESELGNDIEYTNKINNGKYTESDFSKDGAGYGLAQWTWHTRKKGLYQYAKSKEANIDDENIQVQYLIGELSIGGGADGYAKYMLGGTVNGYTASDWENAKTVEDATKAFCYVFENPGTPAIDTRIIYAQQFYEMYQGRTAPEEIETDLTGENKENMQLLIAEAKRIANDDSYTYSQTYREAEYSYDCSSFVSRLYTQYFGISRLDSGSGNRGTDNIKTNCTSQYTVVNVVNLQPGDILWKDGHVALYIGNNQIAEAKNPERGIVIGTYNLGSFTEAYRIIK